MIQQPPRASETSFTVGPDAVPPAQIQSLRQARRRIEEDLDQLLARVAIPKVALQIQQACREQDLARAVSLLEIEPSYCLRLLTLVNSPIYGHAREIASIRQAVVILGFNKLNQWVMSLATKDLFQPTPGQAQHQLRIYEHSLACAALAQELAGELNDTLDSSTAFLAGMLHDVGKLVLLDLAPDHYPPLMLNPATRDGVAWETELFGIDHAEIGLRIGERWSLPPEINEAIARHHQTATAAQTIPEFVATANQLVKAWAIGSPPCEDENPVDVASCFGEPHQEQQIRERTGQAFELLKSLI